MSDVERFGFRNIVPEEVYAQREPEAWRADHLMTLMHKVVKEGYWPIHMVRYGTEIFDSLTHHRELFAEVFCSPLEELA